MEKSVKSIILTGFLVPYLGAAPYIEYKNEAQFQYDNYIKNSNYFREATLINHISIDGIYKNVVIHSKLKKLNI